MANRTNTVNHFELTEESINELEAALSTERLGTYLDASGGDRAGAMKFYAWNTALSAAFYGPLQGVEIVLRNAMNSELASVYGNGWYDRSEAGLDSGCIARVERVKRHLRKNGHMVEPSRVIPSLSFGVWISLLGPGGVIEGRAIAKANYDMTLWRPALCRAFPNARGLRRRDAYAPLSFLKTFRNQIAHHEPIFNRHLQRDYERILEVISWINPLKGAWIEAHSRIPDLLASPRDAEGLKF